MTTTRTDPYNFAPMQAQLERMTANMTDDTVLGLMVRMSKNGQQADRRGDAYGVAQFEAAWNVYHAEALRRGLVTQ